MVFIVIFLMHFHRAPVQFTDFTHTHCYTATRSCEWKQYMFYECGKFSFLSVFLNPVITFPTTPHPPSSYNLFSSHSPYPSTCLNYSIINCCLVISMQQGQFFEWEALYWIVTQNCQIAQCECVCFYGPMFSPFWLNRWQSCRTSFFVVLPVCGVMNWHLAFSDKCEKLVGSGPLVL